MGYKLKTKRAAAKRFTKSTASGKIVRSIRCHGHFLSKMGNKARKLAGTTYVDNANFEMVDSLLPYFGAKRKRTKALRRAENRRRAEAATTQTNS